MYALRTAFLKFLVWNMDWMVRFAGPIARIIISVYARNEVIACGIRERDGELRVIFTPERTHRGHYLTKKERGGKRARIATAESATMYRAPLVRAFSPDAPEGAILRVFAKHASRKILRTMISPSIMVKKETVEVPRLLTLQGDTFTWHEAARYAPMIYFLLLNGKERAHAGVYMTATAWRMGTRRNVALAVGDLSGVTTPSDITHAELMLIDYDGWVTHRAKCTVE